MGSFSNPYNYIQVLVILLSSVLRMDPNRLFGWERGEVQRRWCIIVFILDENVIMI